MTIDKVLVPLKGSERFHRSGSEVVRRSDPDEMVSVTVKVRRRVPLPEPGVSALSRTDVLGRFGADPKDLDLAEKTLRSFGLSVSSKSPEIHALEVEGPVRAIEAAFGVKLSVVRHGDRVYRGRIGAVHIPQELDGIVTGVFGLDTRPMVKHRRVHKANATVAAQLPPAGSRPWFTPQELAVAYAFPPGDGTGRSIGILEFGGRFQPADLASFLQIVGLPGAVPNVLVRDIQPIAADDQKDPEAIGEVMLDIEVVAALCPKASIVVLFSQFTEQGWMANIDAVLTDPSSPSVVSVSYGLAEGTDIWTQGAITEINDSLKALALAGITVCVSSGDDGSEDQVPDGAAHLDFPAGSPYVLSVGGTSLRKMSGDEVVWFDGDGVRPQGGSSGGGVSALNARPQWQQSIEIASVNRGAPNGRIVPDVAANAAGSTGYMIVAPLPKQPSRSAAQIVGGTSASTPLWASLIARLQEAGKNVGFLTPKLYQSGPTTGGKTIGEAAFRDITAGTNASGGANGYEAGPGFDAVTGWGSPIGSRLFEVLPSASASGQQPFALQVPVATYLPPANLKDFDQSPNSAQLYADWNAYVTELVQGDAALGIPPLSTYPAFFDPLNPPANVDPMPATPTWSGLPGLATRLYGAAAGGLVAPVAAKVDAPVRFGGPDPIGQPTKKFKPDMNLYYRPQDEYLEWALQRDAQGNLTSIIFTCESPDYWTEMWKGDSNLVVSLYQRICGDSTITKAQLSFAEAAQDETSGVSYNAGDYNPYNNFNRDFAVHLTQRANTLGAEVFLGQQASQLWGMPPLTTDPARICCAQYGEPNRNSDPTIGATVNGAVLSGKRVSLINPIALYIAGWDSSQISVGDQPLANADQLFQVVRGTASDQRILRILFAVPAGMTVGGAPVTLSMLSVAGEPLTTGGQIANLIRVHLFAATASGTAAQTSQQTPQTCTGKACFSQSNPNLIVTIDPTQTCPATGVPDVGAAKAKRPKAHALARKMSRGRW